MILRNKDNNSSQEKETSESEEHEKKKKEIEKSSEGLFEKEEEESRKNEEYLRTPLTSKVKKESLKGDCIDKYVVDYFEHVLRYHQQVKEKLSIGNYKDKFLYEVVPKETCHVLLRRPLQSVKIFMLNGRTNETTFTHKKEILHEGELMGQFRVDKTLELLK